MQLAICNLQSATRGNTLIQTKLLTLKAPLTVVYEVTPVCDYACSFCYAACNGRSSHPSLEHITAILDRLAQAEVCQITFMGGEFFLHPHWEEILAYARQQGFLMGFISNGSTLTEKTCQRIQAYMPSGAISLHGPNAAVHDALTGRKGSFDKALRAMRAGQHNGIRLSVLLTPTQDTYRQVWDMARTLVENGVRPDLLNVSRLTPHGCALECWSSIRLELAHYLDILGQAARIEKDFGINVRVGDGFPRCQIPAEWRAFAGRCDAGVTLAAVGYQGNVKLCPNSAGELGNLLHTPLSHIWANAEPMAQLRALEWLPAPCRRCPSAPVCKSGCIVSRPNVRYFDCDDIPPSDGGLAKRQKPKGDTQPAPLADTLPAPIQDQAALHLKPSRRHRLRQDLPGTIVYLENGAWFLVDDLGQAVIEQCTDCHTWADLYRSVAARLDTTPEQTSPRVNAVIDLLVHWGLYEKI